MTFLWIYSTIFSAIDHIILTNTTCEPNLLYCDFDERDMCEWSNEPDEDNVEWTLRFAPDPSPATGPSTDQGGRADGTFD